MTNEEYCFMVSLSCLILLCIFRFPLLAFTYKLGVEYVWTRWILVFPILLTMGSLFHFKVRDHLLRTMPFWFFSLWLLCGIVFSMVIVTTTSAVFQMHLIPSFSSTVFFAIFPLLFWMIRLNTSFLYRLLDHVCWYHVWFGAFFMCLEYFLNWKGWMTYKEYYQFLFPFLSPPKAYSGTGFLVSHAIGSVGVTASWSYLLFRDLYEKNFSSFIEQKTLWVSLAAFVVMFLRKSEFFNVMPNPSMPFRSAP